MKNIKIFPYQFSFSNDFPEIDKFKEQFLKDNMENNYEDYGDCQLLLIIENKDNPIIYGRLLKLRSDAPSILNKMSKKEKEIELNEGDLIKEESHFLLDIKNNLLIGEYNYNCVRHFSTPLKYYLKRKLGIKKVYMQPIPNPETFYLMKKGKSIKELEIGVSQIRLSNEEQSFGKTLFGGIKGISTNDECNIKLIISSGKNKNNELKKDELIKRLEELHTNRDDFRSLKISTEDGKYDILNGNWIHFQLSVRLSKNNKVNSEDFYKKCLSLYNDELDNIKRIIKSP